MLVKLFDANHELDLEEEMNKFLSSLENDVIDIKYQVALSDFSEDQVYSFSAMIVYRK
ncbi:MAG: sporulation protein Cse60 [Mycoplasmatota bacterium]